MWLAAGTVRAGMVYRSTDEFGKCVVENKVHVHDLYATILHLLDIDHKKLTYKYSSHNFRLTVVAGNVVRDILAYIPNY